MVGFFFFYSSLMPFSRKIASTSDEHEIFKKPLLVLGTISRLANY